MKKFVLAASVFALASAFLSAGDVAVFVDGGFSSDGKSYVFGQYGKTDVKFQGWAELYQVDIKSNDYVDGGVFRIKPTAVTSDKSGKEVFEALEAKSYYYMKNLACEKADVEHVLYVLDNGQKSGSDEIVFKDFRSSSVDSQNSYHVQLVPTFSGNGKDIKSSFYIMLEKRNASGDVILRQKIGSPQIVRKGVSGYRIERIMSDRSEKKLIFVVEKMTEDDTGVSVRYMVEAAELKD